MGILIGTVVVQDYLEMISRLKRVLEAAGKKWYEVLVGKLNEPKLKNISVVDIYVFVGCQETSLIDPKQFMMPVVTPHEVMMALQPSQFPWQSKIQTDFSTLLGTDIELPAEEAKQDDSMALVSSEHRELVGIYSAQVINKYEKLTFKGLDLATQQKLQGEGEAKLKKVVKGKTGIASMYETEQ